MFLVEMLSVTHRLEWCRMENNQNIGPRCCATCMYFSHMTDVDGVLEQFCCFGKRSRSASCFNYCKHWKFNKQDDESRLIDIEELDKEEDRLEEIRNKEEEKRRASLTPEQREAEDLFRKMFSEECLRRIQQNMMIDKLVGESFAGKGYDCDVKIGDGFEEVNDDNT